MAITPNQDNSRRLPAVNYEDWEHTPDSVKYLTSTLWEQITNPSHQLEPLDKRVSLRDVLYVIRKRWLIIILILASTVMASVVYTHDPIPVYQAKSILLVGFGRGYISRLPTENAEYVFSRDREVVMNAELQILHSRDLIASVIDVLGGPKVLYPELVNISAKNQWALENAVNRFLEHYSVEPVPTSDVIDISFRHQNPEIAASAVNQVVHFFKEKHNSIFKGVSTTEFLTKQVSSYRGELEHIEAELTTFLQENKYLPPDEYGKALLIQQNSLKKSIGESKNQITGLKNKIAFLKKESVKKDFFADPEADRVINKIKTKLMDLQLEEHKLLSRYKETSSVVVEHRNQIDILKSFLKNQKNTVRNSASYKQFQMDIIKLQSELSFHENIILDLSEQLVQVNVELQKLPEKQDEYRHLIHQRDLQEENYYSHLKKLVKARISDQADHQDVTNNQDVGNVKLIQKAVTPNKPAPSGRKAKIAIGILLGITLGLGLAFFVENISSNRQ